DYEGETVVDSEPIHVSTPRHADDLGIAFVQQELSLVPEMTVAENIFLGREPQARLHGFVDFRSMSRGAEELLGEFALRLPIHVPVRRLSAAARQLVEIAKGLSHRPRVLILDEPTSSLSHRETEELHDL